LSGGDSCRFLEKYWRKQVCDRKQYDDVVVDDDDDDDDDDNNNNNNNNITQKMFYIAYM